MELKPYIEEPALLGRTILWPFDLCEFIKLFGHLALSTNTGVKESKHSNF
jgi:hypothetical protein